MGGTSVRCDGHTSRDQKLIGQTTDHAYAQLSDVGMP